jgi:hypothetical protein
VNENCADRRRTDELFEPAVTFPNAKVREMFETESADVLRNFSEACRAEFGNSRTMDRRSNVAQPAITRTMIVPHIVFTMLATG